MVVLLFLAMPLLGIASAVIAAFYWENGYKKMTYLLFLLLAFYMGLINSTKVPFGDQLMYYEAFISVPHRTLWENMTGIYGIGRDFTTKEMGFGLLNVIGYYISFGNYALYITLFTFSIYMLLFDGLYKWFHYLKVQCPLYYIISAVFILAFFTQYFNITIHLQRQVVASAVMVYAIVLMVIRKKVPWALIVLSVTLHTSVGLFLPIFLLYHFSGRLTPKQIFLILGALVLGISAISILAGSLLEILGGDVYALKRLENMSDAGREERMSIILVLVISVPLSVISLYNIKKYNRKRHNSTLFFFLSYLFIMIFSAINPNNTMQYRYFMMSYTFLPFILPLLSRKLSGFERGVLVAVPLFLFLRFYSTFDDIAFDYAPVETVLISNVFDLFNYNHI